MKDMTRVLFVCYGNICRSPMAEFIFRDMVKKRHLASEFYIESAGTSDEEEGNPVYYAAASLLKRHGLSAFGKCARQLTRRDYNNFDYILGMDSMNMRSMMRIFGGDPQGKVFRLLDFTDRPRDIDDPWYSRDFEKAFNDITKGCEAFLDKWIKKEI